jgi:hypothetical protein
LPASPFIASNAAPWEDADALLASIFSSTIIMVIPRETEKKSEVEKKLAFGIGFSFFYGKRKRPRSKKI